MELKSFGLYPMTNPAEKAIGQLGAASSTFGAMQQDIRAPGKTTEQKVAGGMMGALGGAATGAAIGAQWAPMAGPTGVIVGGAVGLISGLLG